MSNAPLWHTDRPGLGAAELGNQELTDEQLRVRIVEVTTEHVVVQTDDFGAIDAPVDRYELPWPAPAALRAPRPTDPVAAPWG